MASEEALPALIPSLKYTKPAVNGDLPPVRGGHGCVLADMQLVIFGGHAYLGKGEFEYLNDVWCLDIQSLTWQKVYPHGQGKGGRGVVAVLRGESENVKLTNSIILSLLYFSSP